ncbi:uncharacterized protein LOC144752264 [Lissotriton helveticus]
MNRGEGQRRFGDPLDEDDDGVLEVDGGIANLANLYTAIKSLIVGESSDSEDDDEGTDPNEGHIDNTVSLEIRRWRKRAFIFGICLMFQTSILLVLLRLIYTSYNLRAQQEAALRGVHCSDCGPVESAVSSLARTLFPSMRPCCLQPVAWLLSFLSLSGSSASVSRLAATEGLGGAPVNLSDWSFVYLKSSPGGEEKLLPVPEDPLHSGQTKEDKRPWDKPPTDPAQEEPPWDEPPTDPAQEEPPWDEPPTDPAQEEQTCEAGEELSRREPAPQQEESPHTDSVPALPDPGSKVTDGDPKEKRHNTPKGLDQV